MKKHVILPAAALVVLLTSCASSGGSSDDWSRTYLAPREQVIEAAIAVLEDSGYYVEADREKGRIAAEPPGHGGEKLAPLAVRVTQKKDRIVVDVQTRAETSFSLMGSKPVEEPILAFLHELDLRLRSGTG
jgi:hypothetical protein